MSSGVATSFPPMGEAVVLPAVSLKEGEKQRGTIIFSHGLGDSAHGWLDFAKYLQRKNEVLRGVKFVLTNAPERPVTVNRGMVMRAWYDVLRAAASASDEDTEGMLASAESIRSLIAAEVRDGVEEKNIVVGGFSQYVSPPTPVERHLWHDDQLLSRVTSESEETPILWAHGTADQAINFSRAQTGRTYLVDRVGRREGEGKGSLVWKAYEGMGHELGREELGDVERWLEGKFA
ncbi:hypothetical protein JCM11251_002828 [Rhodosporidiobolus azoricus]